MNISEIDTRSRGRINSLYNDILNEYIEYVNSITFKVGDIVQQKPHDNVFKITSIVVQDNNEDYYLRLPSVKILGNKISKKNLIPTKSFYELDLENCILFQIPKKEIKKKYSVFVYLIEAANLYKIGFSNNPELRLKQIQTHNPHKCNLLYKILDEHGNLESKLHSKFGDLRMNGEWFHKSDKIILEFDSLYNKSHPIYNPSSLFKIY